MVYRMYKCNEILQREVVSGISFVNEAITISTLPTFPPFTLE